MAIPATKQTPVDQFLDGLSAQLGTLPPQTRHEELVRIRLRIEENLRQLERARPAVQAQAWSLDPKNAVWLGVCAGIARQTGIELAHARLCAVALGLLTGPFALIAYLIAYGVLSVRTPPETFPRPNVWRATGAAASVIVMAVLVFLMAQATGLMILRLHDYLILPAVAAIPYPWNWFTQSGGAPLFWTILSSAPLAVLGALPLPGEWSPTLRKTAHAVVALMGIVLAFGVACLLVGALMQVLPHTMGIAVSLGG